ncbi:MAG: ATP-binding cassette domain-containing protein [Aeromicrobium sp.]|uniref:ABC transporter ATP-binding protein n=1 Tax=Aeromicrobium sp. TaxID=1871063 RepID=UPI0039E6BABC
MPTRAGEVRARLTWRPIGRREPTIRDLDLRVEPGERVLLVGPSGSGKSTLLQALAGALGTTVAGDLDGRAEVGGCLGLVPQSPVDGIVADRIDREVAFGPENLGLPREEIRRRIAETVAAVGLPYGLDHPTSALSGGEQQRLVLAGVLAMRPDVMALDEPTSMLDAATAAEVRSAVLDVVGERTLIVVEHRFDGWLEHVDRMVALDRGQVVFDGPSTALPAAEPPGLWLPGRPAPAPVELPAELVGAEGEPVALDEVVVELTTRTLRGSRRTRALDGLTARFAPGRVSAMTGPSGSGKSTALLAASGLVRPVAGTVTPDRSRLRPRALAAGLGWSPQNPEHGFVTTRARDEVERTAAVVGREVDAGAVLEAVGLSGLAEAHPFRLSGGEQRRLALAAALAHRPGLVVLDEPTVGQDPDAWALVAGWMTSAARHGATVLASTHDADLPRDVEVALAARA